MAETFRQEVREVIQEMIGCGDDTCPDCKEYVDSICAAAVEMGKRMKVIKMPTKYESYDDMEKAGYFNNGIECCQAFIAKECDSK